MMIILKWKRTTAHLSEIVGVQQDYDDDNENDYHSDDAINYDYDDDDDDFWQPHTCLRLWEYNVQRDHMLPISNHLTACRKNEEFEMGRNVSQ